MGIFVYLRASRLPFLTGSLFPVAAATALAYLTDHTWNSSFSGSPPGRGRPCTWEPT